MKISGFAILEPNGRIITPRDGYPIYLSRAKASEALPSRGSRNARVVPATLHLFTSGDPE